MPTLRSTERTHLCSLYQIEDITLQNNACQFECEIVLVNFDCILDALLCTFLLSICRRSVVSHADNVKKASTILRI